MIHIKDIILLMENVQSAIKDFIFLKNLFYSQRVGTPFINVWTGVHVAVLHVYVAVGKVVLIFLHPKWLGLAVRVHITKHF